MSYIHYDEKPNGTIYACLYESYRDKGKVKTRHPIMADRHGHAFPVEAFGFIPSGQAREYHGDFCPIMSMVEKGDIPISRIDESVGRILTLKGKYSNVPKHAGISDWRSHIPFAWRSAFKAVTLLQNRNGLLPLSGNARVLVCCPSESARLSVDEALAFMVRSNIIPEKNNIEICIYDKTFDLPHDYDAFILISENKCDVQVPDDLADKLVFISAALPYDTAYAGSPPPGTWPIRRRWSPGCRRACRSPGSRTREWAGPSGADGR